MPVRREIQPARAQQGSRSAQFLTFLVEELARVVRERLMGALSETSKRRQRLYDTLNNLSSEVKKLELKILTYQSCPDERK